MERKKFTVKGLLKRTNEKTTADGTKYRQYWIEKDKNGTTLKMNVRLSGDVKNTINNQKWTFPCDVELTEKSAFFTKDTWTKPDGTIGEADILVIVGTDFKHKEHTFPKTPKTEVMPEDWLE